MLWTDGVNFFDTAELYPVPATVPKDMRILKRLLGLG